MKEPTESFHTRHFINGMLGEGAFARVYAAQRAVLEGGSHSSAEVAVKVTELQDKEGSSGSRCPRGQGERRLKRYVQREAEILASVRGQPHSVQCFEHYLEGHLSYIVMERCEMTLVHMFQQIPKVTELVIARALKDVLQGLDGIHLMGIVHRDVKLDNFLFSGTLNDGVVKLCDFGFAELVTAQRPELRGILGSAPFMSPEMLRGQGYDTRTDMWSFGVVAYVLLLGQFPYTPKVRSSQGMQNAILRGTPPPTFTPKVSLPDLACRASGGATDFLREVFDRVPRSRIDAQKALQSPWLQADFAAISWEAESCSDWPDLRVTIESANRQGAFMAPTVSSSESLECAVGEELAALQSKHHGRAATFVDEVKELVSGPSRGGEVLRREVLA